MVKKNRIGSIVCFAFDPWSDMYKAIQQRMLCFSQKGISIFFVNPVIMVENSNFIKSCCELIVNWFKAYTDVESFNDSIFIYTPHQLIPFIHRLPSLAKIDFILRTLFIKILLIKYHFTSTVFWLNQPCPYLNTVKALLPSICYVFDWSDDWEKFDIYCSEGKKYPGNKSICKSIIRKSDIVFPVSEVLYAQARVINSNTFLLRNGTNYAFFSKCKDKHLKIASDIGSIRKPILGYIGYILNRLDFELLDYVAGRRPEWSFVFIGPVMKTCIIPTKFKDRSNVYFLGKKSYSQLHTYLNAFDVCIMPHVNDEVTSAMDPIKIYDYLASGKPIVSTLVSGLSNFAEIRDLLLLSSSPNDFLNKTEEALNQNDSFVVAKRQELALNNSCERRVEFAMKIINEFLINKL